MTLANFLTAFRRNKYIAVFDYYGFELYRGSICGLTDEGILSCRVDNVSIGMVLSIKIIKL